MAVAPQPEAVDAAVDVLRSGGNAVDAAVAGALVQTVVDPLQCGIAGFGSMAVWPGRGGTLEYLDFHAAAPLAARAGMWEHLIESEARDGWGYILSGHVNEMGYQSICAPGTLAALAAAHREFGQLPWEALFEPAVAYAEHGWAVRPGAHRYMALGAYMGHAGNPERLALTPAGRALYCGRDGRPRAVGEVVRNPDYAACLRRLATHGAADFYHGDIARVIVDDLQAGGGLLTGADLEAYRPTWRRPLWGAYRGWDVGTNNPPGGGIMLLEMLNILEHFDFSELPHNGADHIQIVSEAMRRATVDKDQYIGDPAFVDVPIDRLLSAEYAAHAAAWIRAGERVRVPRFEAESASTTHLGVVDGAGGCVSVTHSLGMPSGVVTAGLGFMYNGCMSVFDPRPGHTHSIEPGKARFSSIMPSILFRDGVPALVVGAPGGTQIAMGVLQAVMNVIDFGLPVGEAVQRPRFSATGDALDVVNRISRSVTGELETRGYQVIRSPMSYGIGMVHAISISPDGSLSGGADPFGDGMALAVQPC